MAANKMVTLGPVAMVAALTTPIFGPPSLTLSGGANNPPPATTWTSYYLIRHIRIVNTSAGAVTFSLFKAASGLATAGKEIIGTGLSVAPNSAFDWYGIMRIASSETDKFINGGGSTALTIQAEAEVGIE